jgi:hypothetical protein
VQEQQQAQQQQQQEAHQQQEAQQEHFVRYPYSIYTQYNMQL